MGCAENNSQFCILHFSRLSSLVSRLNSHRYHGATILGVIGAGVPPLLGALTLFAYWGALKVFPLYSSPKLGEVAVSRWGLLVLWELRELSRRRRE